MLRVIHELLISSGTNPAALLRLLKGAPEIIRDYRSFKKLVAGKWKMSLTHVCLKCKSSEAGTMRGHYFHQDLYFTRKVFLNNPTRHVDVGSPVHGFVANVSIFREIEVFDIRPMRNTLPNIHFKQMDLQQIPHEFQEYCDSLSCLHALEHFGLGRYGDPLDPDGYIKGFRSLSSMIRPGGRLYLSVPIGRERVEFNAHRIFHPQTILNLMHPQFDIGPFSYVDDQGDLIENVDLTPQRLKALGSLIYGCGFFEAIKR
jgi:hypothetical protein